jgi:hypothetical protein
MERLLTDFGSAAESKVEKEMRAARIIGDITSVHQSSSSNQVMHMLGEAMAPLKIDFNAFNEDLQMAIPEADDEPMGHDDEAPVDLVDYPTLKDLETSNAYSGIKVKG